MKKDATVLYPNVKDVLFHWFTAVGAQNSPISGPVLQKRHQTWD